MSGSDGFGENPQAPLSANDNDEDNLIDESVFGPQKKLTAEEQAEYDAWFRRKVGRTLQKIKDGTAEFKSHEDVMAEMEAYLKQLDHEAGIRDD